MERSGYVRGLGLGPTPLLWDTKSSLGNIVADNISNKVVQRLEQEVKELKEKHNEEMNSMKQNQEKLLLELSFTRQVMCKFFPTKSSMPNGSSFRQARLQILLNHFFQTLVMLNKFIFLFLIFL